MRVDSDGFSHPNNNSRRTISPGPCLISNQSNRFDVLHSNDIKNNRLQVSPLPPVITGVWTQKPDIFGQSVATMPAIQVKQVIQKIVAQPVSLPSSPFDSSLLSRKRSNQAVRKSWADQADDDDSDCEDEEKFDKKS